MTIKYTGPTRLKFQSLIPFGAKVKRKTETLKPRDKKDIIRRIIDSAGDGRGYDDYYEEIKALSEDELGVNITRVEEKSSGVVFRTIDGSELGKPQFTLRKDEINQYYEATNDRAYGNIAIKDKEGNDIIIHWEPTLPSQARK